MIHAQPIRLHPENPHYLEYRGEPLVLVTSAEHYGAVINGAFDYERYLETLDSDGMNYTRIFTGAYVENAESTFGIARNTLGPESPELFISPWQRTDTPGANDGGNLFDLNRWNPSYFERLRSFVRQAEERDIIIEVTFFSSIYRESNWEVSPLHSKNNTNGLPAVPFRKVHTLENGGRLPYQLTYVRKIVTELNEFDNVFFELQNEPWSDQGEVRLFANPNNNGGRDGWWTKIAVATDASLAWQHQISRTIADTEAELPKRHLIAQNYANFKYPVPDVDSLVSIVNFHYAWPEAVALNYGHRRVISFDESGFTGDEDATYRKQAWRFMIAGGGIFNNLDYSFVAGFEDGTFDADSPGGGSPELRKQLRILSELLNKLDLPGYIPDRNLVISAPGFLTQSLVKPTKSGIVYLERVDRSDNESIVLAVEPGSYHVEWIDPVSGETIEATSAHTDSGALHLACPEIDEDAVLMFDG